ncbi:dTDP-4-dehydrorhamnose reductase [Aquimarina sp. EL_43]|uniref:dTDP-4-dehydrorhamnose reductase n=1 Tax=unclassified Aquimarina TaxID=2627091 RepID=UPI0018CB1826|nr:MULTISPECIES: dTDP-4-dehydrorhamnose reductase [unclassified Aquimarina]MBG6131716.1 dTDP-4-dehydrorhamnose reductase [Aquimarina sp. EL_35]MBG6152177.1 dTDP-4-dehydrorhamnose reductase [Aquimarina sp. EL_32]MBG6169879.1 dTDP-4-dehydrorhamnose reductase [Aquimarina sp. EL_43]
MEKKSKKNNVLITGSSGQLGQCIEKIKKNYPELQLYFASSEVLDITKNEEVQRFFKDNSFNFVVNCAAYTNVDQAEKEPEKAFLINAEGVKNLAEVCKENEIVLVHISTDYVFDGSKETPYTEEDTPNPINEYGKSKLAGEQYIQKKLDKYFIIRTSWLYSEFGHNFFKTILKKSKTEQELTIVTSETGTPTNANDLAKFILNMIMINHQKYGIYHFSNLGEATWYDFANEILRASDKLDHIMLKKTDNYPTFAQRPKYSVLSKQRLENTFDLRVLNWKQSLMNLYSNIQ